MCTDKARCEGLLLLASTADAADANSPLRPQSSTNTVYTRNVKQHDSERYGGYAVGEQGWVERASAQHDTHTLGCIAY